MGTEKKGQKGPEQQKEGKQDCIGPQCKSKEKRFGFCDEHYDQFKFGLINKAGQHVPDYEKKFEHWLNFKQKRSAQKVA